MMGIAVARETVGDRIKSKRLEMGLTCVQLAELVGATKGIVSMWETGARRPGAAMARRLSEVLGIDEALLLRRGKPQFALKRIDLGPEEDAL